MTQPRPPSGDEVLAWIGELEAEGSHVLADGEELVDDATIRFGRPHLDAVAIRLVDLKNEGLLKFEDLGAKLQVEALDRIKIGSDFRLSTAGGDRVNHGEDMPPARAVQIVHATTAQVAAGDINNFGSFDELLDRLREELDDLEGVDPAAQEEARTLLDKLRAASGDVATGSAASAGGAVLGAALKQLLGLP